MVTIAGRRVEWKRDPMNLIWDIVMLMIAFYLGNEIIGTLRTTMTVTSGDVFYDVFVFLGLISGQTDTLIGVLGIIIAMGMFMRYVKLVKV